MTCVTIYFSKKKKKNLKYNFNVWLKICLFLQLMEQKLELTKVEMGKLKSLNKELMGEYDLDTLDRQGLSTKVNYPSESKMISIENSLATRKTENIQSELV